MASLVTYKGLSVLDAASGDGGAAINDDLKILADRTQVFGASGASHAAGIVPDPGATAGASRFLREDTDWHALGQADVDGLVGDLAAKAPLANSVTWQQPIGVATLNAGDVRGALYSAFANTGLIAAAAYGPNYYLLLDHRTDPSLLDYKIVAPDATSLTMSCSALNANDGNPHTASIWYSLDGGANFTSLASGAISTVTGVVTVSGTLTLSATSARSPVIVRFRLDGAVTSNLGLIGWTSLNISSAGGPLVLLPGSQPYVTYATSGVGINNQSPQASADVGAAAATDSAGTTAVLYLTRPFNPGFSVPQLFGVYLGAWKHTASGEPNTLVEFKVKSTNDLSLVPNVTPLRLLDTGTVGMPALSTYASDAAAGTGGLVAGDLYKDSGGGLHVKL